MKVSYLTAPVDGVLTIGHNEEFEKHPNYLYVRPIVKDHQNFLAASASLHHYALKHPEITEIEMINHPEILYYLVLNKHFLNITNFHYSDADLSLNMKTKVGEFMVMEARAVIEKGLLSSKRRAFPREMKLSICMSTFNRTRELEEALVALANQSDKDFELVVVNDGSNDEVAIKNHKNLKEKYFKNSTWKWIDQENAYLGAARNRGAKESSGSVLLFLDDDNIPELTMVENYRRYYKETESDVFVSNLNIFHDLKKSELVPWFTFPDADFSATLGNVISDAQCLIDKNLFLKIGGYTTDRNVGFEDWEFFLKLKLQGVRIHPIVETQYFYRIHKDDVSMRSQTKAMVNNQRAVRVLQQHSPRMSRAYLFNIGLFNANNYMASRLIESNP